MENDSDNYRLCCLLFLLAGIVFALFCAGPPIIGFASENVAAAFLAYPDGEDEEIQALRPPGRTVTVFRKPRCFRIEYPCRLRFLPPVKNSHIYSGIPFFSHRRIELRC